MSQLTTDSNPSDFETELIILMQMSDGVKSGEGEAAGRGRVGSIIQGVL